MNHQRLGGPETKLCLVDREEEVSGERDFDLCFEMLVKPRVVGFVVESGAEMALDASQSQRADPDLPAVQHRIRQTLVHRGDRRGRVKAGMRDFETMSIF